MHKKEQRDSVERKMIASSAELLCAQRVEDLVGGARERERKLEY